MKAKIILIVMLCLTVLSINSYAQNKKDKKSNKQEVVFDVSMTCESCKKKIEKNIAFEKGVSDMTVDLPAKTVMVVYQANKTSQENIQKALEKLGYEVSVHNEDDAK